MADGMNTSDVELVVGLDLMLGNESEFVEELSKFQDTDIKLNINGTDKNLSEIGAQLMQIIQGEEDVAKKSKAMATALGNDAKNIKTVFEQIIKQITSNLQNTYQNSGDLLNKGKIADYYSQLNSMKEQANILQGIVRKYEEVFDKLDTIEINNKFYDRSNLNGFIQDLSKAATEQKKYLSGSSKLKKELENAATKAKEDIVKNPAMSSVVRNTIATLGKEFKLLDDEITKNISDKNYDGLSDKIKKMYQLKTAIEELMTQSGIETVKQQDTPLNVSVKKDTKYGINTRFDNIVSQASKIKSSEITTLIEQINKGAINADESIQALIEDCFKLNQSIRPNNTISDNSTTLISTIKNETSKISAEDKDLLDEAIEGLSISKTSDFPEALKILVDQFNKMAQINFNEATKILTQKLRKEEFIDKKQTLKDFEEVYKKDLSNLGISFYKPEENTAQILTASSTQNVDDNALQAATEAQKQAEAEAQQYKTEIDSLNSQIATKDKELETLNKKVNDLRTKLNDASKQSSKEEVSKLKSEIESKNKEKAALEKEIQDLRSKVTDTQSELKSEDNSAEIEKLQSQLSDKTKENEALKKSNEELKAAIDSTSPTASASNINTDINNIEQINKALQDYYVAYENDVDLTLQKQMLEKVKALYDQLPNEEKIDSNFTKLKSEIENNLKEVNGLLEEKNQKQQEEIRLSEEAKIKETELYKEIIKYQKEYEKVQSQDGSKLGLSKRQERKDYQNKLVLRIEKRKKMLQEQYPNFSSEEIWSDSQIADTKSSITKSFTKSSITKSLTGLNEKVDYAKEQSLKFIEGTTKLFDDYCKQYDGAKTSKEKEKILKEMLEETNRIDNNVVPIEQATQKDLDAGAVATSEAISDMIGKFEKYILQKQQELIEIKNQAEKASKTIDSKSTNNQSTKVSDSPISSGSFKNLSPKELAAKTAKQIESRKNTSKATKPEVASTVTEISKVINPLQITDITVTEQAKTKLKTEINNAIATVYVSDVKLADGVLLSELQKEISTILNTNPVEVQITPKFDNTTQTNEDNNTTSLPNGVSINVSSIDFANEEVLTAVRSRIEQALTPIFIQKVDGDNADISSLENKIALALNVIKIDRVELNDNFDIKPLQRDIEKYISKIKLSKIDSKDLAKTIKDEVEKALKGLKSPEFEVKAKITDSEEKQFDKLSKTIDKVTTSITNKNDAIKKEKELVNEGVKEEIEQFQKLIEKIVELKNAIGTIKKIRVYFEKEETDNNEKKEQDSNKPKTKRKTQKQVTGTINDSGNSSNSDNQAGEKKEVLTKTQKKRLLEEELKFETKIAKIKYQIYKEESKNDKADKQKIEKLQEELKITEQIKGKLVDHQKNGITSEDIKDFIDVQEKKVNTAINNEANAINKGQKNIGIENTQEARKSFSDVQKAMEEYNSSGQKTIETLGKLKAVSQEVINTNQAVRSQISNSTGENALNNKYERLITKMKKWASDNPLALKDNDISNTYTNILKQLEDTSKRSADEIARLESEFNKLDGQIRETGQTGRTFTGEMKNLFSILGDRALVGTVIQYVRDGLRQMVTNVREIDRAMTELKKVTDETSKSYNNFLKEAGTRAEALGTTMTDLISSTADFAKLGYSLKDAATLAENAIIYSNVGDLDIQTATNDLVSATKAFGIEAENVTKIVDSFNEVGNNYAVSAQQIGEALQNSASSLVVAGNDIDQSIAMITAMTEIDCCLHIKKFICFRFLTIEVAQNSETPSGIGQYCG